MNQFESKILARGYSKAGTCEVCGRVSSTRLETPDGQGTDFCGKHLGLAVHAMTQQFVQETVLRTLDNVTLRVKQQLQYSLGLKTMPSGSHESAVDEFFGSP